MDEFHGNEEKLKKTKHGIITENKKKQQIRLCKEIYREIIIKHTTEAHSEPS